MKLNLVLVFQVIISISSLPSENLWNKTLQYILEGKMKTFGKIILFLMKKIIHL